MDRIEITADFHPSDPQPGVACAGCGCTDDNACLAMNAVDDRLGCVWIAPGLCSECDPELYRAVGKGEPS